MTPNTPLTFYLDWLVCAQFAGIVWAQESGLYEAAGLNVRLVPWHDDGRSVIEKVVSAASNGELCAGCVEDNLIVTRCAQDGAVQAFGAMLQDTPLVVMSHPSQRIRSVADLRGKRVGMHPDGIRVLELVLALDGISTDDLDLHEVGFDLDHLRQDRFDALQGYMMTEPVQLAGLGLSVDVTPVKHLRLKPYAQTYFSETTLLAQHHRKFTDFLTASSAGWVAACAQPDEAAAVVSRVMHGRAAPDDQRRTETEQRQSLDRLIPLVVGDLPIAAIGSIEMRQWKLNLESYFELDMINHRVDLTEVVCDLGRRSP